MTERGASAHSTGGGSRRVTPGVRVPAGAPGKALCCGRAIGGEAAGCGCRADVMEKGSEGDWKGELALWRTFWNGADYFGRQVPLRRGARRAGHGGAADGVSGVAGRTSCRWDGGGWPCGHGLQREEGSSRIVTRWCPSLASHAFTHLPTSVFCEIIVLGRRVANHTTIILARVSDPRWRARVGACVC